MFEPPKPQIAADVRKTPRFGILRETAYVQPGESASTLLKAEDFSPVSPLTYTVGGIDPEPYDVIIQCSDNVFFAAHSHILLAASANRFCGRLPSSADARHAVSGEDMPYVLTLPEDSTVLDAVLHTIYDLSYEPYPPSFKILVAAVDVLKTYAIPITPYLARGGSLYNIMLEKTVGPIDALEVFAFAAENAFEDLAVDISPRVLCYGADRMPNTLASRIGALYLKRLFTLRERRHGALRMLMKAPLFPHAPDRDCTIVDRQDVTCEWLLAAARVVWDFGPGGFLCLVFYVCEERARAALTMGLVDISPSDMKLVMGSLSTSVCADCRGALAQQINDIVAEWELVKVSGWLQY